MFPKGQLVICDGRVAIYIEETTITKKNRYKKGYSRKVVHKLLVGKRIAKECWWNEEKEEFVDPNKPFSSIALPIVRRTFSTLVAQDLVSVQPMSLPAGQIFHLDYTYGSGSVDSGKPIRKVNLRLDGQ